MFFLNENESVDSSYERLFLFSDINIKYYIMDKFITICLKKNPGIGRVLILNVDFSNSVQ